MMPIWLSAKKNFVSQNLYLSENRKKMCDIFLPNKVILNCSSKYSSTRKTTHLSWRLKSSKSLQIQQNIIINLAVKYWSATRASNGE